MGQVQNNFDKALNKAIEGKDKMFFKSLLKNGELNEHGADTSWADDDDKVTLQDILELTKDIPIINYPTKELTPKVLGWKDNPEEIERISQVEVSRQYPILIMVNEYNEVQWILDGNHRTQQALMNGIETIPAKLIKPSDLDERSIKIFYPDGIPDKENLNKLTEEVKEEVRTHKGKKCSDVHPGILHSKWVKGDKEEEVGEQTTSASAGAFSAPLGFDPRFKKKKKEKQEEVGEQTTAASSGAYETPQMWAKNEKNWRGAAKTQWPGGKFVKIKKKCGKFPYCNQGDINALELSENNKIKKAINEVSKKTGKDKGYIKKLVKKEIEEIISRSFYKSPITSLVGKSKMNTPIGKIFTMGTNVGGKYE